MLRFFITACLIWLGAVAASAGQSTIVDTGRVNASLVSSHDLVRPGQTIELALLTELDEQWHTYWRNPGDSGEAVYIEWTLPDGASASELYWPAPKPIATGPIINYGFEGAPLFPVTVTLPETISGEVTLSAYAYYLVCKDICIPEDTNLTLTLPVGDTPVADPSWGPRISASVAASPKRADLNGAIRLDGEEVVVDILTDAAQSLTGARIYPFAPDVIDHSAPMSFQRAENGVQIRTQAGWGWDDGAPEDLRVLFSPEADDDPRPVELVLNAGADIGLSGLMGQDGTPVNSADGTGATLIVAVFGALIGGLILNLMPCVFPVISIKALSLAKTAHGERAQVRREGWAYTIGVLVTLLALAGLIIALKAGGAALGWGFQLQDPRVVGLLALLTFLIGLNFLGAFEIGTRLQNTGNALTQGDGTRGAFFTGILAVIVATPCTAPFMAGAIGYALAQPALTTLLIFAALGIGFAAPFLLLAYTPSLLRALPKPGPWMETFRQFLAFPMLATSIWLAWVLGNQAGSDGLAILLIAALVLAFALWLSRRAGRVATGFALALAIIGLALPLGLNFAPTQGSEPKGDAIAWSPETVAAERASGRAVFVDFTADWCVTCKVNERMVLSRDDVQALFADLDTAFVVADWTNKNDAIAEELERFGRAGIPLYLVYPPGDDNSVIPQILPQILTKDMVEAALREANETG